MLSLLESSKVMIDEFMSPDTCLMLEVDLRDMIEGDEIIERFLFDRNSFRTIDSDLFSKCLFRIWENPGGGVLKDDLGFFGGEGVAGTSSNIPELSGSLVSALCGFWIFFVFFSLF